MVVTEKIPEVSLHRNSAFIKIKGPYTPIHSKVEILEVWIGNEIISFYPDKDSGIVEKFKEIMELVK